MRNFTVMLAILATLFASVETRAGDAIEAFERAKTLYEKQKYNEAAAQFRRANELKPNWKIAFNIGQCEALAKRPGLALQAFEIYLTKGGDDIPMERRMEVENEVQRLRALVGRIEIVAPKGATIIVDGVVRGDAPLTGKVPVAASIDHKIVAMMNGKEVGKKIVQVIGGETEKVNLFPATETATSKEEALVPVADSAQAAPVQIQIPVNSMGQKPLLKTIGWGAIVLGGSLAIGGAATGAVTASKASKLDSRCPKDICTDGEDNRDLKNQVDSLALTTDILLPVGGVIGVVGIVMLLLEKKKQKENRLTVSPILSLEGTGMQLQGRF